MFNIELLPKKYLEFIKKIKELNLERTSKRIEK